MEENRAGANAAGQVELAILKLDSLAVLPAVAAEVLVNASASGSASALGEIVEADPALSFNILALARAEGRRLSDCGFSVGRLCEKLPEQMLRETVLKSPVQSIRQTQAPSQLHRIGLTRCNIGAACCAGLIAKAAGGGISGELAYTAGLLHNVGLFALAGAMPKSFARIVEEAAARKAAINIVEQEHLGTDHTILGKRLAQKLGLPPAIIMGIWLSHTDSSLVSQALPQARVAQMVRLACIITRDCGIGQSPDFGEAASAEGLRAQFSISAEQLRNIRAALPGLVAEKTALLGLDKTAEPERASDVLRAAAIRLALSNSGLSGENQSLRTAASLYNFIAELLTSVRGSASPAEAAKAFASLWQRTYQTGKVCLALNDESSGETSQAVIVESQAQSECLSVDAGALTPVLTQFAAGFDVLKADVSVTGLLERLDADFEIGCTRVLPLLSSDGVAGLLIFEFRYPVAEEQLKERFEPAAKAAAAILSVVTHSRSNEQLAERIITGIEALPEPVSKSAGYDVMAAVTELAAGAAHEMNNPLSVISGRAQFLSRTEIDPERKRTLAAIQKNAGDLSGIIDDLMSYASPPPPKRAEVGAAQIIDEAAQLAAVKTGVQNLGVEKEIANENLTAFVDSAQVVSAIANIIANAVESYEEGSGPVKVSASAHNEETVEFKIADNGCGMDSVTLAKATHPFFSAKPAGRRRGMGLAHALRLIELNGGSLRIESAAGTGTTVAIYLPRK